MPDIPIQNGPTDNSLPDWAIKSISALHTALGEIYGSLLMPDIAALHAGEAVRVSNLESTTANLAKQLDAGFVPGVFTYPKCASGENFIMDIDGRCKLCGSLDPMVCNRATPKEGKE